MYGRKQIHATFRFFFHNREQFLFDQVCFFRHNTIFTAKNQSHLLWVTIRNICFCLILHSLNFLCFYKVCIHKHVHFFTLKTLKTSKKSFCHLLITCAFEQIPFQIHQFVMQINFPYLTENTVCHILAALSRILCFTSATFLKYWMCRCKIFFYLCLSVPYLIQ